MKKLISTVAFCLIPALAAWSQARPTASRAGDLQIGGNYAVASSDYDQQHKIRGFGFYADFDFREHFGVEVDFHQLNDPSIPLYERSYEVGGRYVRRYGPVKPYVRAMYGRGVFNFPTSDNLSTAANLAYNQVDFGGGLDIPIISRMNARVEYEYQHWFGFPPNGLTPQMVTVGVAYHFPPGKPR